jgi:hypothetical protein
MIGIPYAKAVIGEDGQLASLCPECHRLIPERTDGYGESIGNPYGEHYAAEHQMPGTEAS